MRLVIATLAALVLLGGAMHPSPALAAADSGYAAVLDQQPTPQLDVDIDVDEGGGAWWTNPIWIAIGIIGALVVILLIVMAARGGGTTIVKE